MDTNTTMTSQYKWPPNNFYIYPMKLKYGLEDLIWNSESIGVDLDGNQKHPGCKKGQGQLKAAV